MRVAYHLAALVTIGLASPARADDYRIAVGTANAASATVFTVGALLLKSGECKVCFATTAVGFAGLVLAAPVVHAVEENYGRMGISLGAHLVFPAIGLTVGTRLGIEDRHIYWGLMSGFIAATVLDLGIAADDDPAQKRMVSIGGRF